jgi:hypothetical protein
MLYETHSVLLSAEYEMLYFYFNLSVHWAKHGREKWSLTLKEEQK